MAASELPTPVLSPREREVAALVAEGLTNREIAGRLFISERTVDGHLEHIREKLAMNSRAQVAAWFVSQPPAGAAIATKRLARPGPAKPARIAMAVAALVIVAVTTTVVGRRMTAPSGPIITTVVGSTMSSTSLEGGFTGDGGKASYAQLSRPSDVAAAGGYLYIADTDNGRIRRVTDAGVITTLVGGGTVPFVEGANATTTDIGNPMGVAVGPDGLVYFSSGFIARVNAYTSGPEPGSSLHAVFLPDQASPVQIFGPAGLCFAPDGSLYIADYFGDKVWLMRPDGTMSVYAGTGVHGFSGDNGSALDARLSYPNRLALDRNGNLYIADEGNNRIRLVDHEHRRITTIAGSSETYGFSGDGGPAAAAKLNLPAGVAVAANGDIYIADTGNNRVRRVDARTHNITTVAGTGDPGLAGDTGPATQAMLYGPVALAVTTSGDLYVVDLGNHRVRLIKGIASK